MPTYITFSKITEQGIREIKNAPEQIAQMRKAAEAMGGKILAFYLTLGDYDFVGIAEWPNDEMAMAFLLQLNALGGVKTTTLKAFTLDEFARIVQKLP
jgi:uncharacterized protein with GYD domain